MKTITRTILPGVLLAPSLFYGQVTTSQYDNARTGANLNETILTPQNVSAGRFGKLFSLKVDGDIYAQPLYLPGVEIPGKGRHNVVFIATEHDSVYAFDADGQPSTPLWQVNFVNPNAGITTVPDRDVRCPFIRPEIGITPTPVIDIGSGTIYVLARTKESQGALSSARYVQRLHALAITTGAEKFGGPVEIKASAKGRGAGASNGQVDFDPLRELPRAGLVLTKGNVFLTWASSCDVAPYHGWIIAYDAHTLNQTAVFNTSPDAEESGIWQSDTAPAADADGNIFVATGNGKFDVLPAGGRDYGDSVLKLALSAGKLELRDFFTPFNQQELNGRDADLGSGGPVLLPDQPGPHPHLLIVGGKAGALYVLDRDRLGKWQVGSDSNAVQVLPIAQGIYSAPAYWNKHLFIFGAHSVLKVFALEQGKLSAQPVARGTTQFIDPGATPTISANGSRNGIVWVLRSKGWRSPDTPAILYAFDAANVARELYNSEQNGARDRAGLCLRFNIPTVVNGKVYVGAKGEVDVFGLLPSP
jgi:outer membrane protein assembly factor BamB